MKIFTNKNIIQKMIIILVFLIMFNFTIPKPVNAGLGGFIMDPIISLVVTIVDAFYNGLQWMMTGQDANWTFMRDRSETSEYYGPGSGPSFRRK